MIGLISLSPSESIFRQSVALDGADYGLRFRWNDRAGRWHWLLEDADGEVLVGWRKLVANAPLLAHLPRDGGMPPGEIWCVTVSGDDPGLRDLGAAMLFYVSEDQVA